jgi:hypothetical protein
MTRGGVGGSAPAMAGMNKKRGGQTNMATTRRVTAWERPFGIRSNAQFNLNNAPLYVSRMPFFDGKGQWGHLGRCGGSEADREKAKEWIGQFVQDRKVKGVDC